MLMSNYTVQEKKDACMTVSVKLTGGNVQTFASREHAKPDFLVFNIV